jgi:hypothetical protein
LELFVDTDEMNSAKSLDELIKMVEEKLKAQDLG